MFELRWTNEAERDLENILAYYLEQGESRVAEAVYARIMAHVGALAQFPDRCRPGRVSGTKEYVIHRLPYIAVVEIGEASVSLLNLIHTARRYPPDRSPSPCE